MKTIFIFLISATSLLPQEYNFTNFLKTYKFKIFSAKKEVGYINIEISSHPIESEKFLAKIESYTDIPILFFLGKTYNYEVEEYDKNFVPINSKIITKTKNKEIVTIMVTTIVDEKYKCILEKENKRKELFFKHPIIVAGNVIPLVSTFWDFYNEKRIKFKFINKERLNIEELNLEYLGVTEDGLFIIKAVLPYFGARFLIYVDKDKNIRYAEGLGLKIYSVE